MKHATTVAISSVAICLAGCASGPKLVVQEPVGPCHRAPSDASSDGSLQVFSASAKADVDVNQEEWRWNNDFGKNEFLHAAAHSGYTILAENNVWRRVPNARGLNDETPAIVKLHPGSYTVEAKAEAPDGGAITVVVPFVIEAGQSTTVHLEPGWNRSGEAMDPRYVVRLSDGRIIGCRAQRSVSQAPAPTGSVAAAADGGGQP